MISFTRLGITLALVVVPTVVACGGVGEDLSVGADAINGDGGEGGTGSCTTAAECGADEQCGFAKGSECTALGSCFSTKGLATCALYLPGCACDGSPVNLACNGLPDGYTAKPILHQGACTSGEADAAAACQLESDCPSGATCAFPQADGCAAKGVCVAKNNGALCNSIQPGCACDGTFLNLGCNGLPAGFQSRPFLHTGACADGG